MSENLSAREYGGCVLIIWSCFVTTPLWLFLLYSVLTACGEAVPFAAWVAFFVYVPAQIFSVLTAGVVNLLTKD